MDPLLHIVKIGGKLINDKNALSHFLDVFTELQGPKLLIHGGGRKATELSALLGIETKIIDGRRITDKETLEVAIMVYGGLINKQIVSQLQKRKINALGVCGADANLIRATKRPVGDIDYGFVGDITSVNAGILTQLLDQDIIPVLSPLSHDGNGQLLNTNADTIAAHSAIALSKNFQVKLSYCFEYPGVLYDIDTPELAMSSITINEYIEMKDAGSINSGMIPKLSNGFDALKGGVSKVTICGIDNLISQDRSTSLTL